MLAAARILPLVLSVIARRGRVTLMLKPKPQPHKGHIAAGVVGPPGHDDHQPGARLWRRQ